ncbi:hypothetical protein Prudu_008146 [Prunus dulcis]|uniref:Uncharacterized protein n=1 Tax=Prunus dulcis TaxID=3755 RepID=A0A4Y1R3K1_PRUDU|nr:hypothetical protein Prudu_008146 [Prunus dulcis]
MEDGLSTDAIPGYNKISKELKSAMSRDHATDGENNSEQRTDDGRSMKSQESKRAKRASEGDRSQTNQVSAPANQTKDASDGVRTSNQAGTSQDLIAKRKKQREAVDAILYSALIPSKKSEKSMKPVPSKRPLSSSSTASGGLRCLFGYHPQPANFLAQHQRYLLVVDWSLSFPFIFLRMRWRTCKLLQTAIGEPKAGDRGSDVNELHLKFSGRGSKFSYA